MGGKFRPPYKSFDFAHDRFWAKSVRIFFERTPSCIIVILWRIELRFKDILLKKTCWDNQLLKQIYSENY